MSPIRWLTSFEIGHEVIDRQHRKLVKEVAAIEGELKAGRFKKANAKCRAARYHLKSHLKYEERFLADHDFPRLSEHIESHTLALRDIEDILAECCEDCQIGLKLDCATRWYGSILHHVLMADADFRSYLQNKGIIPDH